MDSSEISKTLYRKVSVPSWRWNAIGGNAGEKDNILGLRECGVLCDLTSDCNTFKYEGAQCVLRYVSIFYGR